MHFDFVILFFFKQKTAYEMRISDWSSDVCSSDLFDSMQTKIKLLGYAENLVQGISLGSVLLLAAVGLAITFGVMGIINMAHGEMIMQIGRASCRERVCQYV